MKIIMFVLIFLILGSLIIINNNDIKMSDSGSLKTFSELYFDWIGNFYLNIKTTTGNAVKLDWFPE